MADDTISHEYASQYYDPAKAHEYYLKNRELKGKRQVSKLSRGDKEIWATVKSNITDQKKAESKKTTADHQVAVQKMRESAQGRKQEIRNKIQAVIASVENQHASVVNRVNAERTRQIDLVQKKAKADFDKVVKEAQNKIEALPPLGDNPTKAEVTQRNRLLASIKKDLKRNVSSITKKATADRKTVLQNMPIPKNDPAQTKALIADGKQQVARVGEELKVAVESSKKKYEDLKKGLAAKYETIYQTEFDKIKGTM